MSKLTAILTALGMALLATPFAVAAGEGDPLLGGVRNPSPNEREALQRETEIIANTSTYGTRQSNKSDNGGGAIYGCRSLQGGTPANREPCVRANNLSSGLAFEFESDGNLVGTIKADGGPDAKPFTTNATGVATGLNADRVDGKDAEDLNKDALAQYQARVLFASVTADGKLGDNRGATGATNPSTGIYEVSFGSDVSKCAQQATVRSTDPRVATLEQVDADTVRVRTFEVTGTAATAADPAAFHLTVTC